MILKESVVIENRKKMKITFILPTANFGGGIRVISIYAQWLTQRGHSVELISQPPPRDKLFSRKTFKNLITGKGLGLKTKQGSHLDGLTLHHRVLDTCRPPIDKDVPDADIIIATWWLTAEWVNRLSANKGAKVYFIQHHEIHKHLPVERTKKTYLYPFHKIVIAKWLKDMMRDRYCDNMVDLVPNSVDHSIFYSEERNKRNIPTVGFVYSPRPFKGCDVIFEVIKTLKMKFLNLKVISFGASQPDFSDFILSEIEFHLSPTQSVIRELYSSCDLWLSASRSEGFYLPAMEAMACRTPVVSTKTGWPLESIKNGFNGYLAEIDDVHSLVNGVASILELTNSDWAVMSANAFDTVKDSSWDKSAEMFEESLLHACKRANNKEIAGNCTLIVD